MNSRRQDGVGLALLVWLAAVIAIMGYLVLVPAQGHWKPEYAQLPQAVQDWYQNAELTPAAHARLHYAKCCNHADVVKTKFKVGKTSGKDEWWWLDQTENMWRRVPDDVIHWDEYAPGDEPVLFVYDGKETCFFPPRGGL